MAALVLIMSIIIPSLSYAVIPKDCRTLEAAYVADAISQYEDFCFDEPECLKRQMLQLREAAKERDTDFDASADDDHVERRYGSDRTKLWFGDYVLDGVALYVDFISSVTYYEQNVLARAPITYEDGRVLLGNERCDVPLGPYLSLVRKENLCASASEHLDLETCLDSKSEFRIENLSEEISQATISFSREADDGRVELLCMGTVERATDAVIDVTCLTPDSE